MPIMRVPRFDPAGPSSSNASQGLKLLNETYEVVVVGAFGWFGDWVAGLLSEA